MSDHQKILVVGKSSYIGQNLHAQLSLQHTCKQCNYDDFFSINLSDVTAVINCCFDRHFYTDEYDPSLDLDLKIVEHIAHTKPDLTYVMLSTRAVYLQSVSPPMVEDDVTSPISMYGRNKLITEEKVSSILSNILILRIANVIGKQGLNKHTFASVALRSLIESGIISLDINPESLKDFVPIEFLSKAIESLLGENALGTFNVGSGVGISVGEIAQNIVNFYGAGKVVQTDNKIAEEFILNIDKLKRITHIDISKEDILMSLRNWVEEYK